MMVAFQILFVITLFASGCRSSLQCSFYDFPYAFGGVDGDTIFYSVSVNQNSEILAGGLYKNTQIGPDFPLLVLFDTFGDVAWANVFDIDDSHEFISNAVFVGTSEVAFLLNCDSGCSFDLIVVDIETGNQILRRYQSLESSQVLFKQSLLASGQNLILVGQFDKQSKIWKFGTTSESMEVGIYDANEGIIRGAIAGATGFFFGGYMRIGDIFYNAILKSDFSLGIEQSKGLTTIDYQITQSLYLDSALGLFGCGVDKRFKNIVHLHFELDSEENIISTTSYSTPFEAIQCYSVFATPNFIYSIFPDKKEDFYAYFKLDLLNLIIEYEEIALISASMSNFIMYDAVILSESEGLYVGHVKDITSPRTTFGKKVGYVMSLDYSQSCISEGVSTQIPGQITMLTDFVDLTPDFTNFSFTQSLTRSITSYAIDAAFIRPNPDYVCRLLDLQPTYIPDQTYNTENGGDLIIQIDEFFFHEQCSGQIVNYTILDELNQTFANHLLSHDSQTNQIIVNTNESFIGSYNIVVTGVSFENAQTYTASSDFILVVTNDCLMTSEIVNTSPVVDSFSYILGYAQKNIDFTYFSIPTNCNVAYTLSNIDQTEIDANIFTFIEGTPSLSIYSTNSSVIGTYEFILTATIIRDDGSISQSSQILSVYIFNDPCNGVSIISSPITGHTYDLSQGTITLDTLSWYLSNTSCQLNITYEILQADYSTFSSFNIYFENSQLIINEQNENYIGTQNLVVKASISLNNVITAQAFEAFTLQITDLCSEQALPELILENQTYIINSPLATYSFEELVISELCGSISYQASVISPKEEALPNSFLSFDPSTFSFSYYSDDTAVEGVYKIYVQVILGNLDQITSFFYLELIACSNAEITFTFTETFQKYRLGDNTLSFLVPFATSSYSSEYCGIISYQVVYDSTIIEVTQQIDGFEFNVETSLATNIGLYNIQIIALLQDYTQNTLKIKLEILSICDESIITTPEVQNQIYEMNSSPLLFQFDAFNESMGYCGSFTYRSYLSSGFSLPNFISFDSQTRQFEVQTSLIEDLGQYSIIVEGTTGATPIAAIQFELYVECEVQELRPSSISKQEYIIGKQAMAFSVQEFEQFPACNKTVKYTSMLQSGEELPNYIYFDSDQMSYTIYTDDLYSESEQKIKLIGEISNRNGMIKRELTKFPIQLIRIPEYPEFVTLLQDQTIYQGDTLLYILPDLKGQNSAYLISVQVTLSKASSFITYQNSTFVLSPTRSIKPMDYPIKVDLKNQFGDSSSSKFFVKVLLKEEQKSNVTSESNFTNDNFQNKTPEQINSSSQNSSHNRSVSMTEIIAQINSVSHTGVLSLQFCHDLIYKEQLQTLNSSRDMQKAMIIKIERDDGEDKEFDWFVKDVDDSIIKVQLVFKNQSSVFGLVIYFHLSVQEDEYISVLFNDEDLFTTVDGNTIPKNYKTNSKLLPPQTEEETAQKISNIGSKVQKITNSVGILNFAINLVLQVLFSLSNSSSSLTMLWGMINTLQILCVIPLFCLKYPANVQLFFQYLTSLAHFDFFPQQKILFFLNYDQNSPPLSYRFNEMDIFWITHSFCLTPMNDSQLPIQCQTWVIQ